MTDTEQRAAAEIAELLNVILHFASDLVKAGARPERVTVALLAAAASELKREGGNAKAAAKIHAYADVIAADGDELPTLQ